MPEFNGVPKVKR